MTIRSRTLIAIVCVLVVLASVVAVGAQARQEKQAKQDVQVVTVQSGSGSGSGVGVGIGVEPGGFAFSTGQGDNTFVFVSSEMSFDGKTVKGAPYSAQAVTESVQTLADGNRIVHRNTASIYRDSDGRTRREQTINAVGAYSASGDLPQMILINDPVAGVNYILDVKSHTARKIDLSAARKWELSAEGLAAKQKMIETAKPKSEDGGAANAEQRQKETAEIKARVARAETEVRVGGGIPGGVFEHSFVTKVDPKNTKKEALGKQTIEGVEADGVRFTTTIAPGEIGNEQPINIVSERWYSEELQTVVMSKHSDPRLGESTYRLTNINRSEPAHSLFELPSDYTVKETIEPGMGPNIEKIRRREPGGGPNIEEIRRREKKDQ